VAFKAEELTSKIFPGIFPESGAGIWAACPQDTIPPGRPPMKAEGPDRDALVLLQAQLRDRMAQGSAAGL
jgi:hypothetical protein